jgi:hypothetical protein
MTTMMMMMTTMKEKEEQEEAHFNCLNIFLDDSPRA